MPTPLRYFGLSCTLKPSPAPVDADIERGRMIASDRVAIVGVVGNEDGAHHVGAEVFQGLNDVGFTLAAALREHPYSAD